MSLPMNLSHRSKSYMKMPEALINKSDTIPNINGRGGPWPHWFNVRLREVAAGRLNGTLYTPNACEMQWVK